MGILFATFLDCYSQRPPCISLIFPHISSHFLFWVDFDSKIGLYLTFAQAVHIAPCLVAGNQIAMEIEIYEMFSRFAHTEMCCNLNEEEE